MEWKRLVKVVEVVCYNITIVDLGRVKAHYLQEALTMQSFSQLMPFTSRMALQLDTQLAS